MHQEMANAMKRLKKLGGFGKLASMFNRGGMEKALAGVAPGGQLPGGLPGLPGGSSPFNLPPVSTNLVRNNSRFRRRT